MDNIKLPEKIFYDHGLGNYIQKDKRENVDIQINNNIFNNVSFDTIDTSSTIGKILALFQVATLSLQCAYMYSAINYNIKTAEGNIDWANKTKDNNESNEVYKRVFELYTNGEIHVVENNKVYKRNFEGFIASVAVVAVGALTGSGVLAIVGIVSGLATSVFAGYHFAYHFADYRNITEQLKEVIDKNNPTTVNLQTVNLQVA